MRGASGEGSAATGPRSETSNPGVYPALLVSPARGISDNLGKPYALVWGKGEPEKERDLPKVSKSGSSSQPPPRPPPAVPGALLAHSGVGRGTPGDFHWGREDPNPELSQLPLGTGERV